MSRPVLKTLESQDLQSRAFEGQAFESQVLPHSDVSSAELRAAARRGTIALADVPVNVWHRLAAQAIEPNGYYLPDWARACSASARDRTDLKALTAWQDSRGDGESRLIGLMPAISAWRAFRLPLPALVSAEAYGALGTPLVAAEAADAAVAKLMDEARGAGAHALVLRDVPLDGPVARTFTRVLGWTKQRVYVVGAHDRAVLNATAPYEAAMREALGAKKLKELRRQRNRLADNGDVRFTTARTATDASHALDDFLALEASGWKGRQGTALACDAGDATFIRRACTALATQGACEIVTLTAGASVVAVGIVLRHGDRAFFFKIAVDENFAKLSPGVQLTLDLTAHLCADESITLADSTAVPGHPMIGPLWRGRMRMGDLVIPLRRRDPLVALIVGTLRGRLALREALRPAVHYLRSLKNKETET